MSLFSFDYSEVKLVFIFLEGELNWDVRHTSIPVFLFLHSFGEPFYLFLSFLCVFQAVIEDMDS